MINYTITISNSMTNTIVLWARPEDGPSYIVDFVMTPELPSYSLLGMTTEELAGLSPISFGPVVSTPSPLIAGESNVLGFWPNAIVTADYRNIPSPNFGERLDISRGLRGYRFNFKGTERRLSLRARRLLAEGKFRWPAHYEADLQEDYFLPTDTSVLINRLQGVK